MFKKLIFALLFLLPVLAFAQTGKIVGSVYDTDTGEPLVGANVLIEGTFLGGATDINGEYIILNIPPGRYDIKALYVGYRDLITQNVVVSVNLTTTLNLTMTSDKLETEAITIVAVRPLVNKNTTNATSVVTAADIENLPVRGVANVVAQQAGIVTNNGNVHVRGSRGDGVAYYVDGVLVNNPVSGGAQTSIISNAIEEIQFQAGGYSAEFGGANGGIISTHSKTGGSEYKFNAEAITDNFAGAGKDFLGGYSYGYSEYVFSVSGPLVPDYKKLKFFVIGSNVYRRSPASFHKGFDFEALNDPSTTNKLASGEVVDALDVSYPDGHRLANNSNQYQVQGNLTYDLSPITLKWNSNFRVNHGKRGRGFTDARSASRARIDEDHTFTTSLKATHVINQNTFYDVIVNYFNDFFVRMDPDFRHDISLYGDSLANAELGYTMDGDSDRPNLYNAFGWSFNNQARIFDDYTKQRTETFGAKFDFLWQANKHNEVKFGANGSKYTVRNYNVGPLPIASLARSLTDGNPFDIYNRVDNYGYDVYGNENSGGAFGPREPMFGSAYIQDKIEYSDLVINAGLRFDYIDIDGQTFEDPNNVPFNDEGEIDETKLVDVDPYMFISPRLGFSFPVTDKTKFLAQYGKFVQQSKLRDVYLGAGRASDIIKGGFAELNPVGYGLKPEKLTQYDIGFQQQLGESFSFSVMAFYKDIKDQIQARQITAADDAEHLAYYALVNGDFATTKGLEVEFSLRRTSRISANLDYSFSDARGTGSTPTEGARTIWQQPPGTNGDKPYFALQIAPLGFNQSHRGSFNLDYRFTKDDGPDLFGSKVLSQFGANFLFTFNSGTNYTRYVGFAQKRQPLEALNNSVTPWNYQLDLRLDKTFEVGPLDANIYLWVTNVFNTENVIKVFPQSGNAYDDGWLTSDEGSSIVEGYRLGFGEEAAEMYKKVYKALSYDRTNFGPPRQIRLGLRLDF